jgi:hypothetical protein
MEGNDKSETPGHTGTAWPSKEARTQPTLQKAPHVEPGRADSDLSERGFREAQHAARLLPLGGYETDEGTEMFVLLDQTQEMRSFDDLEGRRLVCIKRHVIKAFLEGRVLLLHVPAKLCRPIVTEGSRRWQ